MNLFNLANIPETERQKIGIIRTVLIVSILLLAIKFLAWYLTHSNAILTDALESIVNVVAGAFALFSIYYASQPRDENHPYGHGKMEFLSAGFEGGLIFIAGLVIVGNSIYALFKPTEIHSADIGAILTAISGLINFIMGKILVKKGIKNNSLLMIANGKHLISDTVSSVGLVVGLVLIWFTKIVWIDQLMAIIFGAVILYTGFGLLKKSVNSLLDEADYEKLNLLITRLEKSRREKWIDIHNLRVIKYGANLHVDCHITLPWYEPLEAAHEEVTAVEQLIRTNLGSEVEFFIHADPCITPTSCTVCQVYGCSFRKAAFEKRIEWTMENMLPNKKHSITSDKKHQS